MDSFNVKPHYYKAKALERLNNLDDAVLSFEQVLKLSDSSGPSGMKSNALYEITKIRVRQRDFYEAYYSLQRAEKA